MDEAMKLAEEIAAQAPIAVALCKEAINVGMQTDLNSALKLEGNVFGRVLRDRGPEVRHGLLP